MRNNVYWIVLLNEQNLLMIVLLMPLIILTKIFITTAVVKIKTLFKLQCVGCDTRSYRLHQVSQNKTNEIIVFEVDFQDVLDYRTEILESECKAQTNATIHKIACDLRQTEKLIKELKSNGFNEEIPNIWILEGVITYFTEDELHNLLDVISNKLYKKSKKNDCFQQIFIANCGVNDNMMKQGMNDVWKQSRQMDENIAKMGNNKPHLLLEKYGYNKYNILVAGGMIGDQYNGSYEEYLKKI